ncbi:MAG: serine/threonine-protein kinase [Bryobacteraceae bacterium]
MTITPALHFKTFGKYEIIRKLGRSMTDVYLALDPDKNRRVVLKIVEHSHDAFTQVVMEAEKRGAAIQKQLHAMDPRILEIYDFGEQNGCFFVAMEYVEGKSLAELLRQEQRLDPKRAARIAIEVCSQLQTLHSFEAEIDGRKRAVVHGDIKPANIQIGPHDETRLLDFGIAKAITSTHNLTHHNLGSPAYCSPERVKSSQVDQHADLWALGVSLYEMVSGMPPYQAQNTRKLENIIQSRRAPRALPESCPASLRAIVSKALAADASHRYASATLFEHDLQLFLQNRPTAAETEKLRTWDANATLDKSPRQKTTPRVPKQQVATVLAEVNRILWAGIAGLAFGLLLFVPAGYIYRLSRQTQPLRDAHDYVHASTGDIENDWRVFQSVRNKGGYLGPFSPVAHARETLLSNLITAGNNVIEGYRYSSDPSFENFDWAKGKQCFKHALDLDPQNREVRGRAELCDAYTHLRQDPVAAKALFETAATDIPNYADTHLGLARIYVYALHNIGMAMVQFHEAEELNFRLGPREIEQEADGYLYRAEQELKTWEAESRPKPHDLLLAQRDFERARGLYEPISGFSKVSQRLEQLDRDEEQQQAVEAAREKAQRAAASHKRTGYVRRWR